MKNHKEKHMNGIFNKIGTLVLSKAHSLSDQAIDPKSPASVKQHIDDLETAIKEIETDAAVAQDYMQTASSNMKLTATKIEEIQENINILLSYGNDSNDDVANQLIEKLIGQEKVITTQRAVFMKHQITMARLDAALAQLRNKYVEMLIAITSLEINANLALSNTAAADQNDPSLVGNLFVNNVIEQLKNQANITVTKLDQTLDGYQTLSVDTRGAKVAARLAMMKSKIQTAQY